MGSLINWPQTKFLDPTGEISIPWQRWLQSPSFLTIITGTALGIPSGGTGLSTTPTNGQLLIGNGTTNAYVLSTLTAGTGVGVTNGAGAITVSNSGVTSNIAGTGIGVSGATGAVTISNTGVTSITGTANQVIASGSTGGITLSTPQAIGTGSSPTFNGLTLTTLNLSGSPFAFAASNWTPTDNSGAGLSFSNVSCAYLNMGIMVFAYGTLTYPITVNASAASIAGLPVAVPNQNYAQNPAVVASSVSISGGLVIIPTKNTSTAKFDVGSPLGAVTNAQLSTAVLSFMMLYPSG